MFVGLEENIIWDHFIIFEVMEETKVWDTASLLAMGLS